MPQRGSAESRSLGWTEPWRVLARDSMRPGSRGAGTIADDPAAALVAASPDLAARLLTTVLDPVLAVERTPKPRNRA